MGEHMSLQDSVRETGSQTAVSRSSPLSSFYFGLNIHFEEQSILMCPNSKCFRDVLLEEKNTVKKYV